MMSRAARCDWKARPILSRDFGRRPSPSPRFPISLSSYPNPDRPPPSPRKPYRVSITRRVSCELALFPAGQARLDIHELLAKNKAARRLSCCISYRAIQRGSVARRRLTGYSESAILPAPSALSSRGPGQVVLSHQTGVRIPVALPYENLIFPIFPFRPFKHH